MTRVAGHPSTPHPEVDGFVTALLEALQIPEVKMEIIRIVGRAQTSSAPLARGQQRKGR